MLVFKQICHMSEVQIFFGQNMRNLGPMKYHQKKDIFFWKINFWGTSGAPLILKPTNLQGIEGFRGS